MEEKSGIEMIKEVLENIFTLDRRMQVIEQNMKLLLATKNSTNPGIQINNKPAQQPFLQSQSPKIEIPKIPEKPPIVKAAPNARIVGRFKNEKGKGIIKVNVTIYDDRNAVVKKTRTNNAGDLFAFLPPGKYIAECLKDGEVNENIVFTVNPEDRVVEITKK